MTRLVDLLVFQYLIGKEGLSRIGLIFINNERKNYGRKWREKL